MTKISASKISLFDQTSELQDSIEKSMNLGVKVTSEVNDVSDSNRPLNKNVNKQEELITLAKMW